MRDDPFRDIPVWRDLARLMPGWQPTPRGLQRLDQGPNELLVALRAIAREWSRDDARWDVLQGALEYYKRQHAREMAELARKSANQYAMLRSERMQGIAEGLRLGAATIDPPEVLNGE